MAANPWEKPSRVDSLSSSLLQTRLRRTPRDSSGREIAIPRMSVASKCSIVMMLSSFISHLMRIKACQATRPPPDRKFPSQNSFGISDLTSLYSATSEGSK